MAAEIAITITAGELGSLCSALDSAARQQAAGRGSIGFYNGLRYAVAEILPAGYMLESEGGEHWIEHNGQRISRQQAGSPVPLF